jgi:hypothetical protein
MIKDWILTSKHSVSEWKKEEKKGRRGRRESSNGRNGLCRYSDKGERERMTLFTFFRLV